MKGKGDYSQSRPSSLGRASLASVRVSVFVIFPYCGWYEKDEDGSECDWGTVLDWQPPTRVVPSWHLNGDFEYFADITRASEVEIRFTTEREGWTRVDLEHRCFERHGESGDHLRIQVDKPGGWTYVLDGYTKLIAS